MLVVPRVKRRDVLRVEVLSVQPPIDLSLSWVGRPRRPQEKVVPVAGPQLGPVDPNPCGCDGAAADDAHRDATRALRLHNGKADVGVLGRDVAEVLPALVVVPLYEQVPVARRRAEALLKPHRKV